MLPRRAAIVPFLLLPLAAQSPDGPRHLDDRAEPFRDEPTSATAEHEDLASIDSGGLVPIHSHEDDPAAGPYGTWAAGAKYKVSFHGDATFIPYLGADYPENRPWSWRTVSVRHGGHELLGADENAQRQHDDYRYRYRYSRFTEVWDVRAGGLEQSFVVDGPLGHGSLVIEGRVTTTLRGDAVDGRHAPVTFYDDDGNAILSYGAATVYDSAGRSAQVLTTHEGDVVRLTVGSAWLEAASWPITVDPLLTPTRITWGTLRESADVTTARDANRMVAYLRVASSTDRDLHARIFTPDATTIVTAFSDVTSSWTHGQVRVATAGDVGSSQHPARFAAVFDRNFGAGLSQIRVHVHDTTDLTFSNAIRYVPSLFTRQDWRADVGGCLSYGGPAMLIVYQREAAGTLTNTANSEIWCSRLSPWSSSSSTSPPWQVTRAATSSASVDMERPSVTQATEPPYGGSTDIPYFLVWQEYNNFAIGLDDWDAVGRIVDTGGVESAFAWSSTDQLNQSHHQLAPVVDGYANRYTVSYVRADMAVINYKTSLPNGTSVHTERVDWNHGSWTTSPPTNYDDYTLWGPHGNQRWRIGGIAFDTATRSHWAVTSHSDTTFGGTGNVYINRIGYRGDDVEVATMFSAPAAHNGEAGTVAYARRTTPQESEWVTTWIENDTSVAPTTGGLAHELYCATFRYPAAPAPALTGVGCSTAGLAWYLPSSSTVPGYLAQQIGSQNSRIRYFGAPAGSGNVVALSFASDNTPVAHPLVAPGCRTLASLGSGFIGFFPASVGANGSHNLPLPEWLPTTTLYFQVWTYDVATDLVTGSQRLEVPIVR